MKAFEYANPATLDEAIGLLAPEWGKTEVLAGGTDLVTSMKQYIVTPERVISIMALDDLRGIDKQQDKVRIGALTPLQAIARDEDCQKEFPALVAAIKGIGSHQMINRGTAGGDLCQRPRCWYYRNGFGLLAMKDGESLVRQGDNRYHAIYHTDGPALFVNPSSLAPGLIALGAELEIQGPEGKKRTVPVAEFFKIPQNEGDREYDLAANEVLTAIIVPRKGLKNATYEIRERQGLDWPLVTASVAYADDGGNAKNPVVVLGHVAPVPYVSQEAADALSGKAVKENAGAAGEAAKKAAKPLSMNGYKVPQAGVCVRRALEATLG